jgi:hypothetical protein
VCSFGGGRIRLAVIVLMPKVLLSDDRRAQRSAKKTEVKKGRLVDANYRAYPPDAARTLAGILSSM